MVFFPGLNNQPRLFALFLIIAVLFSFAVLLLARWRRSSAIAASIITALWIILLLPDIWHYYAEWREWLAPRDAIIEPLYRELWFRGYILIFMPVPFLVLGLHLRRKRTI
jgi:hypothetical protein